MGALAMVSTSLQSHVADFLREQARVMPGDGLLVGFSGGGDSVALLHLLSTLARGCSFELRAVHLNHELRPESCDEAEFSRRFCEKLGVPLTLESANVRSLARGAGGIEAAAREARRALFERVRRKYGYRFIVLGHHRKDQAETVLHRLIRGTSVSGLGAMRPIAGAYLRPLLGVPRETLREYLREHSLACVEDPSNQDLVYTRNRIRHELLPLLSSFNPSMEKHLSRLSSRVAEEEEYWSQQVALELGRLGEERGGGLVLDVSGVLALHPALRNRLLREAIRRVRGGLERISADHLQSVTDLLASSRPQADLSLPGLRVARRYQCLWIVKGALSCIEPFCLTVSGVGDYPLPGGVFSVSLIDRPEGEGRMAVEFDARAIRFPLEIRSMRAGDRFRPSGLGGGKKLKDFFIDQKIPREDRRCLPLVVGEEILWTVGLRRCEGSLPVEGNKVLRMTFRPAAEPCQKADN